MYIQKLHHQKLNANVIWVKLQILYLFYVLHFCYVIQILRNMLIDTLPAEMFGGTEFWLYTIIILRIETHPF